MKPKSALRSFLFLAGSSLLAVSSASAQWTQTATGTQQWNTPGNWSAGVPASTAGTAVNLSLDLANTQTVNLATGVTLGSLTFGDTGSLFFKQDITGSAITFDNGGAGATLTQASTSTLAPGNITNNIVLNDNLTLVNNGVHSDRNQSAQLTGVISGSGGIKISSGGTGNYFYINNSGNTYSGGFTLDATNARVVTGGNSNAFGTGTITINAGTIDLSAPSAASQAITTTNANVWNGSWTLAGATSTGIWNNNGRVTLGGNVTVTVGNNTNLSLGGNIAQTGGPRSLTLNGGVNTLSGTNSYAGGTSVGNSGTLNFINSASMPSTGAVSFANGTTLGIGLGGNGWTSTGTGAGTLAGIFQGTNVGVGAGSATLSYTTAVGLNLIVTGSHSFGAIENLGSGATLFTKAGIGSLTITGDNIYTGATSVIGGGALVLDYTSGNATKLNGALTLGSAGFGGTSLHPGIGGGTITLKAGAQTETVSATTLNTGGTFITRDTGTSKTNFNIITRAAGGTISFADASIATTDTNHFGALGVNGILGGWATVGNDWAVSANTGAADTAITALGSYTTYVSSGGSATANYLLSGSGTVTAASNAVGTLKITDSGAGQSLALGSNDLTITTDLATALGGIMYAGGTTGNYEISGGRIMTSSVNQELIFAVQTGNLTVSSRIAASGSVSVTKSGAGTMILSATNNSYTGAVRVNQGVVRLAHATASGTVAGGIVVQNGAALELTGGITVGAEALFITGSGVSNGGALRSVSGANNYGGAVTLGIGGARINNDAASTLTLSGGLATNGAGDVTFGGVGNTTVHTVGINGGGGLIKDGAGTLTLSATNTYIGATTVSEGKLVLSSTGSTHASSAVNVAAGSLTDAPVATLAGTGTIGGNVSLAAESTSGFKNGGVLAPTAAASGTKLSVGGTTTFNQGSIFEWNLNAATGAAPETNQGNYGQLAGTGAITKSGSGAVFKIVLGSNNFADEFWDSTKTWNNIFTGTGATANLADIFSSFGGTGVSNTGLVIGQGQFSFTTTSTLSWAPVPEPTSALAGLLLGAGLLLRRRTA